MDSRGRKLDRRIFLQTSAAVAASAALPVSDAVVSGALAEPSPPQPEDELFVRQKERRKELWKLLGDLPWGHKPGPAKVVSTEEHDGYTLEARASHILEGLGIPVALHRQPLATLDLITLGTQHLCHGPVSGRLHP